MLHMLAVGGKAFAQGSARDLCAYASDLLLAENSNLFALDVIRTPASIGHIGLHGRFKGAFADEYHHGVDYTRIEPQQAH